MFLYLEAIFGQEETQKCPKYTEKKLHRSPSPLVFLKQEGVKAGSFSATGLFYTFWLGGDSLISRSVSYFFFLDSNDYSFIICMLITLNQSLQVKVEVK